MRRLQFLPALLSGVLALGFAAPSQAHEVRPALLRVLEAPNGGIQVLWKQPRAADVVLHLTPAISGGLIDRPPDGQDVDVAFVAERWTIPPRPTPLTGRTISIGGLDRTLTDALIEVSLKDGRRLDHVATAAAPQLVVAATPSGLAVPAYLRLGIEHILTGPDHLLFVLGLLLLIGPGQRLLATISAFTVAHSLTLAGVALGVIHVRPALIEVLVALSIVFVGVELAHARRGQLRVMGRRPWLIAFAFGLLHGAAFAGALAEVGLPKGAIAPSLLLFNLGVEIGQLLFVGAVLALARLASRAGSAGRGLSDLATRAAPRLIGVAGAFWMFDRLAVVLG